MSLIEQATKRLEELRRSGARLPSDPGSTESERTADTHAETVPTPEAAVRTLAARTSALSKRPTKHGDDSDRFRHTRSGDNLAESSGRPRLEIDLARLKARGFVTPDAPRSQIADEFRVVKRPIIHNARRANPSVKHGNLIMVTSAVPREGKTFTAVNLAMSLTLELDTTVMLVDGDVARPDLPNVLGSPKSPGLLELITRDDVEFGDALLRTNIENLSILPAGAPHPHATELLASEQMAELLREMASRYSDRIIVFDSPPLLATTEARVLASNMGQIVVVVAADSTQHRAVTLALSTIESCEIVMMMLNKAQMTDVGAYYGYYADEAAR